MNMKPPQSGRAGRLFCFRGSLEHQPQRWSVAGWQLSPWLRHIDKRKAQGGSSLGDEPDCPGSGVWEHFSALGAASSAQGSCKTPHPAGPWQQGQALWDTTGPAPACGASVVSRSSPLPGVPERRKRRRRQPGPLGAILLLLLPLPSALLSLKSAWEKRNLAVN